MTRPLVLLAESLHVEPRDWLAQRCDVVDCPALAGDVQMRNDETASANEVSEQARCASEGGVKKEVPLPRPLSRRERGDVGAPSASEGSTSPKRKRGTGQREPLSPSPSPEGRGGRIDELLNRAEGLIVRTYTCVDGALLSRMPRLRVVGRAGAGLDNIDLAACADRGVIVVHTPEANTQAVVEYVWTLALDALRPRVELGSAVPLDRWRSVREACVAERELADLTLGIYGFGRIGSRVAQVGAALGMRVIYHDLREIPPAQRFGADPAPREALLSESNVLTVHVDGRPANRGLIDADALARLKPDAIIINTSRGFVVDAAALARFLIENPQALALLDVHEPEPIGEEYPLLGLANARLFPHLGAASTAAHRNMSWVVEDVWRVLAGESPRFPATIQSGP